jgi:hypothetical protein
MPLVSTCLLFSAVSWGIVVAAQTKSASQAKPHSEAANSAEQMTTGVLAIVSDQVGSLFVDGVEAGKASPGNVVALKLVAGQHFIDFRDSSGQTIWEKIINVPAGLQVAERISTKAQTEQRSLDSASIGTLVPAKNDPMAGVPTQSASGSAAPSGDSEDFIAAAIDTIYLERNLQPTSTGKT